MILFKTPRLEAEFNQLPIQNPRLGRLLKLGSEFMDIEFGKNIVVTEIFRTPEENAALYKAAGKEPDWRPHTMWMAADLRSSVFSQREIERLAAFFNQFTVFSGQRKCATYHAIKGNVEHFHIQVNK
jgi:hypothetical protein